MRPGPGCATFLAMVSGGLEHYFYSGAGLDRASHLRRDPAWLAARSAETRTRLVPVWGTSNLVGGADQLAAVWLAPGEAATPGIRAAETIFLGLGGDIPYFAIDLSGPGPGAAEAAPVDETRGVFTDLRAVGPLLERSEGAILAYARGLVLWHRRHRFCGLCGQATRSAQAGHVRTCVNPVCGTDHFPRTDPAVIMLVHDSERCVLGRQAVWPEGMHSTLAGFVEPGESLEEAVAREVREEVGIEVSEVVYHSSQPWPFPASLMLGFHARSRPAPLTVDRHELAAARWYSRAELLASPEDRSFRLPRRDSIARRLVEAWIAGSI